MGTREDSGQAALGRREAAVAAREAALARHVEAAQAILAAADERDALADARDAAADKRERDLDLSELLASADHRGYGDDWPERRNAGLDRTHAKENRAASHEDRLALTEGRAEDEADDI